MELAQLEYNLPRMRGQWKHLERLGGGAARSARASARAGPGESQLESDRRMGAPPHLHSPAPPRRDLTHAREPAEGAQAHGDPDRRPRGYTNVGKSTLLNALTDAEVSVENRLFETLDPTTRGFEHDGRRYLVTDTVGFIRRLPHQLVEGSRRRSRRRSSRISSCTADASQDEARLIEQLEAVDSVLAEIGAAELPSFLVLNKIDRLDPLARRRSRTASRMRCRSALTGDGLAEVRERIAEHFAERFEEVRLLVPYEDGAKLAELYALGAPVDERRDEAEGVFIRARLPHRDIVRFAPYVVAESRRTRELG